MHVPVRFLLLVLVPAPFLPAVTLLLAVSDQVVGACIAGVFSLINTVLLAVLTIKLSRNNDLDEEIGKALDDHASGHSERVADLETRVKDLETPSQGPTVTPVTGR